MFMVRPGLIINWIDWFVQLRQKNNLMLNQMNGLSRCEKDILNLCSNIHWLNRSPPNESELAACWWTDLFQIQWIKTIIITMCSCFSWPAAQSRPRRWWGAEVNVSTVSSYLHWCFFCLIDAESCFMTPPTTSLQSEN